MVVANRDLSQLDWPAAKQVIGITRTVDGKPAGRRLFVTSLSREQADPKSLAAFVRGHWAAIENRQHWVRDAVLGEDTCRVRDRDRAWVLSLLRIAAVDLFHLLAVKPCEALSYFGARFEHVLAAIGVQ